MGATPVEMYKLFFGPQARCPDLSEDAGLSCNRQDAKVSSSVFGHTIRIFIIKRPFDRAILSTGVDSEGKAYQVSSPPVRDRAGSRVNQDAGDYAFGRERKGEPRSYRLHEGGCQEGRNQEFPQPGKEKECL